MKTFYVSSYGKSDNKGIYIIDLNEENQKLSLVQHIATHDYPSYMITKNNILYVAYKNASRLNNGGGIGSFSIHKKELIPNNNYNSNGRSYTHLCVSDNSRYLFAANYHVGSTASYLLENNFIKEKICAIHHTGLGPDLLKRQTGPHCHYVGITPDKEFVYAVDLGADKVIMYTYQDGKLEEDVEHTLNVVPGSGPRHMIFSKDGRFAYLVNEISNNLMVYKYNDKYLNLIQVIHTTPRHFHGFSSASAIRLSATGNHLFISNRGHDSIVLYRVNQETGKVSLLYMVHTGKNPRDFNIIDDKYLIVGAQDDDELELLTFDEKSEQLVRTASTLAIPAPVCIAINKEK